MSRIVKSQDEATAHCRRLVRSLNPFDRLFNFEGTRLVEDGKNEAGHWKWEYALAHRRYVSRQDVEYILNVNEAHDVNSREVGILRHALECLDKGDADWAGKFRFRSAAYALQKLQQFWRTVQLTANRAAHRADLGVFQFPDSINALLKPDVEQQDCNRQFTVKLKGRSIRHYQTKAEADAFVEGFTAALRYQPSRLIVEEE